MFVRPTVWFIRATPYSRLFNYGHVFNITNSQRLFLHCDLIGKLIRVTCFEACDMITRQLSESNTTLSNEFWARSPALTIKTPMSLLNKISSTTSVLTLDFHYEAACLVSAENMQFAMTLATRFWKGDVPTWL